MIRTFPKQVRNGSPRGGRDWSAEARQVWSQSLEADKGGMAVINGTMGHYLEPITKCPLYIHLSEEQSIQNKFEITFVTWFQITLRSSSN